MLVLAGWSGLASVGAGGVPTLLSAVPGESFAAALSPREWKDVEGCVDRSLAWLASQQAEDGSFPTLPVAQPAITSLCVLAFLSRGHQPGFGPYGAQLDRAVDFVISCQRPDGLFALQSPNDPNLPAGGIGGFRGFGGRGSAPGTAATYNHAIAGLMLGEVFGHASAERTHRIKVAIEKALQFSRDLQTGKLTAPKTPADEGGWRYLRNSYGGGRGGGRGGADSDLSVTGWHLMFLRSARNAEFSVPQEYIDDAMGFVHRTWSDDDQLFHYLTWGADSTRYSRGLMGSAIVSLALAGQHQSPQAILAGEWLLAHPFRVFGETLDGGGSGMSSDRFFYSTYYCSQAAAQLGGRYWSGIFPPIAEILVKGQQPDGSFPGEPRDIRFGNDYTTALAVLSLTPAYQLLPVYQR